MSGLREAEGLQRVGSCKQRCSGEWVVASKGAAASVWQLAEVLLGVRGCEQRRCCERRCSSERAAVRSGAVRELQQTVASRGASRAQHWQEMLAWPC